MSVGENILTFRTRSMLTNTSLLSFFSLHLSWSRLLTGTCYSGLSLMIGHTFLISLTLRKSPDLRAQPSKNRRHVSENFSSVFRFLQEGCLGETFPLTSDRQFFSPCFRPCGWKERVLTQASITGHQTRAVQWWECVFRRSCVAQSGFVRSFHSKSWVLWTAWRSQLVCGNVGKTPSKFDNFGAFLM